MALRLFIPLLLQYYFGITQWVVTIGLVQSVIGDVTSQMYNRNTKSENIFWLNLAVYNYLPAVNVVHVPNFSQDNDCGITNKPVRVAICVNHRHTCVTIIILLRRQLTRAIISSFVLKEDCYSYHPGAITVTHRYTWVITHYTEITGDRLGSTVISMWVRRDNH